MEDLVLTREQTHIIEAHALLSPYEEKAYTYVLEAIENTVPEGEASVGAVDVPGIVSRYQGVNGYSGVGRQGDLSRLGLRQVKDVARVLLTLDRAGLVELEKGEVNDMLSDSTGLEDTVWL